MPLCPRLKGGNKHKNEPVPPLQIILILDAKSYDKGNTGMLGRQWGGTTPGSPPKGQPRNMFAKLGVRRNYTSVSTTWGMEMGQRCQKWQRTVPAKAKKQERVLCICVQRTTGSSPSLKCKIAGKKLLIH